MPGLFSIFVLLLPPGPEGAGRLKVETFAHQTFGLLRRTSFRYSEIASSKRVAVKKIQSCRRQFGRGHGDKPVSAGLAGCGVEYEFDRRDRSGSRKQIS